ncbi:MAG: VWA domain-containing protein [Acidimicrobiia bacterium]|nr:VWA domain-containing protein [Acidimicrobiia bacterium]
MSFLSPERLWLLLAVLAVAGVYIGFAVRRRGYAVRFTNTELLDSIAPRRPGWRRHVPAALFLVALTTLVVGFAQPATDVRVPRERATIVLAIDTSISMGAEDVEPTRFAAAKDAANTFVDDLPEKINVGLVSFDRSASIQVPPTTDRFQLENAIDRLELDQYTATGDAILESLEAIETVPPDDEGTVPPARIVLMSDGERTTGATEQEAARAANEAGVPVSTISFGTEYGTIPSPEDGSTLSVAVNPDALRCHRRRHRRILLRGRQRRRALPGSTRTSARRSGSRPSSARSPSPSSAPPSW